MSSKYSKIITENTRLLYRQVQSPFLSWWRDLSEVDKLISQFPNWQLSGGKAHFYFFTSHESENWDELPCWVGRELIGFSKLASEDEGFGLIDLDQGEAFCVKGELGPGSTDTLNDVWALEADFRKEIEAKEAKELAPTWKLSLNLGNHLDFDHKIPFELYYFIQ